MFAQLFRVRFARPLLAIQAALITVCFVPDLRATELFSSLFCSIGSPTAQSASASTQTQNLDHEFLVGDRLAFALSGGRPCSFVMGSVVKVTPSHLTLTIRENVGLHKFASDDGVLKIPYKRLRKPADKYEVGFQSEIRLDDPKPEIDLALFVCPSAFFSYATSDPTEIASMRRAVDHFLAYKKRPTSILDLPRMIEGETDRIFATYLAMFVAGGGVLAFPDYMLTVVTELIENDKFLSSYEGKWRQELGMRMVRSLANLIEVNEVFVAKPETREDSLRRVIEVAGGQRPFTPFALRVIARIKADGSVDIDRYLDATTKAKLRRSYERFTFKELGNDDHAVLAQLLAANS